VLLLLVPQLLLALAIITATNHCCFQYFCYHFDKYLPLPSNYQIGFPEFCSGMRKSGADLGALSTATITSRSMAGMYVDTALCM
jgi:hypothetical protein